MQTLTTDKTISLGAGVAAAIATAVRAAPAKSPDEFIARIKSKDDSVRGAAWQGAAPYGEPAVKPLAATMADDDFETARSARRALWVIVRHAGRPGAAKEARAVASELIAVLGNHPTAVRREVLWMLSEIGSDDTIPPVAALLSNPELREHAQGALMRLPGRKATAALKTAFAGAPEDFKFALADSLRKRGEKVSGYPSQKLVPNRATSVTYSSTG
jgi:HEAT repeat protein